MSVIEKKIRSFLADKQKLDDQYKFLAQGKEPLNAELKNLYEFDKLCYLYYALKSYYETSKCKWALDYRNILHDLSQLVSQVESKMPVDDVLELQRQLAVIRRQYRENAIEGGKVAFAMVLLATDVNVLNSIVSKFLGTSSQNANVNHMSTVSSADKATPNAAPQVVNDETTNIQQKRIEDLIRAPLTQTQPSEPNRFAPSDLRNVYDRTPPSSKESTPQKRPSESSQVFTKKYRPQKFFSDLNTWTSEHVKCAFDAVLDNPLSPNAAVSEAFKKQFGIELSSEAAYTLRSHYGMLALTIDNFQYYNSQFNVVASQFYLNRLKYVTVPWADLKIQFARRTGLQLSDDEIKGRYDLFLHHRHIYGPHGEPLGNYILHWHEFKRKRDLRIQQSKSTSSVLSAAPHKDAAATNASAANVWSKDMTQYLIEAVVSFPTNVPNRLEKIQNYIEQRSGGMLIEETEIIEKLRQPFVIQAINTALAVRYGMSPAANGPAIDFNKYRSGPLPPAAIPNPPPTASPPSSFPTINQQTRQALNVPNLPPQAPNNQRPGTQAHVAAPHPTNKPRRLVQRPPQPSQLPQSFLQQAFPQPSLQRPLAWAPPQRPQSTLLQSTAANGGQAPNGAAHRTPVHPPPALHQQASTATPAKASIPTSLAQPTTPTSVPGANPAENAAPQPNHFDNLMQKISASERPPEYYVEKFRKLPLQSFWDFNKTMTLFATIDFMARVPENTPDITLKVARMQLHKIIMLRLLRIHQVKVQDQSIEGRLMQMMELDVFDPSLVQLISNYILKK